MGAAMITSVQISQNPVTNFEQFQLDLSPGRERREFSDLTVTHRAYGGFWSAEFTFQDSEVALRDFFARGLGRDVKFWGDTGSLDFEGFINEMTLVGSGGSRLRISMDSMYNKVWCRYKDSDGVFARSTTACPDGTRNCGFRKCAKSTTSCPTRTCISCRTFAWASTCRLRKSWIGA